MGKGGSVGADCDPGPQAGGGEAGGEAERLLQHPGAQGEEAGDGERPALTRLAWRTVIGTSLQMTAGAQST